MPVDTLTDDDLIRMYHEGDADAFGVLFDRHYASVYHFARTMLGDAGGAEDVLQETFLAVARAGRSYTPRGRFRAWLMRIVRNRCLNRIASQRARRAALAETGLDVVCPAAADPSPPQRAEAREQADALRLAIATLPERQREAITLYAFDRMTYREVAEVLDMPINTVKTLIHRARANLARALAPAVKEPHREL